MWSILALGAVERLIHHVIDLDAITQQLQQLEKDSQKTDALIAEFCKELGIASPFAEVK